MFKSNAQLGHELTLWGKNFDSAADVDKHVHAVPTDLANKYLLTAVLEAIVKTNRRLEKREYSIDRLVKTQRTNNKQVKLVTEEQPIADARLVCWRLAGKSDLERLDLQNSTGKQSGLRISDAEWLELPPGMRNTLKTAGITHFEQLHYKAWTNLKGMGSSTASRVVDWRDRHEAQVVLSVTAIAQSE